MDITYILHEKGPRFTLWLEDTYPKSLIYFREVKASNDRSLSTDLISEAIALYSNDIMLYITPMSISRKLSHTSFSNGMLSIAP